MRLYLDDVRPCPLVGYDVARTLDEAKAMLADAWSKAHVGVDAVSLDHDLGMCAECLPTFTGGLLTCPHAGNGYDLLLWMDDRDIWPARIDVHSMNPVGAQRMRDFVKDRPRRIAARQSTNDNPHPGPTGQGER